MKGRAIDRVTNTGAVIIMTAFAIFRFSCAPKTAFVLLCGSPGHGSAAAMQHLDIASLADTQHQGGLQHDFLTQNNNHIRQRKLQEKEVFRASLQGGDGEQEEVAKVKEEEAEEAELAMAALVNQPPPAADQGGQFRGLKGKSASSSSQPDVADDSSSDAAASPPAGAARVGNGGGATTAAAAAAAAAAAGGGSSPGKASGNEPMGAGAESFLSSDETAQFERDKRLIYK